MPNTAPTRTDVADLSNDVRDLTKAIEDRDRLLLAALVAILLLIGLTGWTAWEAREQGQETQEYAEQLERAADRTEIERCIVTNGSRRAILEGFDTFTEALAAVTRPEDPELVPRHDARVAQFRDALRVGFTDLQAVDCTGDGMVTEADFPA